MQKVIFTIFIFIASTTAFARVSGFQDADFKSQAELATAGASNSALLNISKIWDNINNQLFTTTISAMSPARISNRVSANFTVPTLTSDYILIVDTSGGSRTITIPDATASLHDFCLDIKRLGAGNVNVTPFGGQTIDGDSSDVLADNDDSVHYCMQAGNWFNF